MRYCTHTKFKITSLSNVHCLDCGQWFWKHSREGQRLLNSERRQTKINPKLFSRLDSQQQATLRSLQDSYQQLVMAADTQDRNRLADYANRSGGE